MCYLCHREDVSAVSPSAWPAAQRARREHYADRLGDGRGVVRAPLVAHALDGAAGLTRVNEIRCRPAGTEDFTFLATMLGEAAVWRPDKPTPTAEQVMADPRYALYLAGWPRQGDYGLVAEQGGPVGAAWYRTYTEANHGYGFVAEDVPELSIAVIASRRHEGIGRRLLVDLVEASEAQGWAALSLSVNHANPARALYESVGFEPVGPARETSLTMIRHATFG
jgi:GNAT superfamily N-acetyltransferase